MTRQEKDDMDEDRLIAVRARFADYARECHIEIREITGDADWLPPVDPETGPSDEGGEIVSINPELIVRNAEDMDDERFLQYLDLLDWMTSQHLNRMHLPLEDRVRIVNELLFHKAPISWSLRLGQGACV
jgi:hypothetical protein